MGEVQVAQQNLLKIESIPKNKKNILKKNL